MKLHTSHHDGPALCCRLSLTLTSFSCLAEQHLVCILLHFLNTTSICNIAIPQFFCVKPRCWHQLGIHEPSLPAHVCDIWAQWSLQLAFASTVISEYCSCVGALDSWLSAEHPAKSYQTVWMYRLIRVFPGHIYHKVHSFILQLILATPCENVLSGICGQWRPRSAWAFVQSDQGLQCPLTESLDTTEHMNREQRPRWYLAHVQDDLNLCILRMFKGTFSLDMAHIYWYFRYLKSTLGNIQLINKFRKTNNQENTPVSKKCIN